RQVVTNHVAARIRIVQGELAGSVMDVREANRARGAWASHGSRERRESLPIPSYRSRGLKAPRRTRLVRCVARETSCAPSSRAYEAPHTSKCGSGVRSRCQVRFTKAALLT